MRSFVKNMGIAALIVAWVLLLGFFEITALSDHKPWAIMGFVVFVIFTIAAAKTFIDGKT